VTRWLVTGAGGMLGTDLSAEIAAAGELVIPLRRDALDIRDPAAIGAAVQAAKPDVVVNCAAWTAVDEAEEREEEALAVNGHAVADLAAACASAGAILVQLSTDYVFDGLATAPYAEDAAPAPRTAYGRTKLAGERALLAALPDAYLVRTAWLYGAHGPNFVRTMIRLAAAGVSPAVVDDQRGQPTWSLDVARQIRALVAGGAPPGVYHATSSGETTWYDLAAEVFRLSAAESAGARSGPGADGGERLAPTPTTSETYKRPAPRPAYSVLGHAAWAAAGIAPIGDWRDALHRAFPAVLAASRP
jgi:dTDP-4-dehydrorhamnose reductase